MSLMIGKYLFTGPFELEKMQIRKNHTPAVYAIVCRSGEPWNPTFTAIDFGESGENGIVFANHLDREYWDSQNNGELGVYLLVETELNAQGVENRLAVVNELQNSFPSGNANIPISGGH